MPTLAIGIDFGTESGRVLVLDLASGEERGTAVVPYPRGVIDRALPDGQPLAPDWALQDPDDWVRVVEEGVPAALERAGSDPADVVGLGVDFTSCTVLPVAADGTPLCRSRHWRARAHAWPKLWKHHAAQPVADRLTDVAVDRGETFLERYGGRISSEWYFPKLIELWLEDREVYDEAFAFVEATDWIVWWLTGGLVRQSCTAGYKAMWAPEEGLPPRAYFEAAYPGFDTPGAKLGHTFVPLGTRAGTLRPEVAETLGLSPSLAVAVGNVDSFVSFAGAGVADAGVYVTVVGTSTCEMIVDPREVRLPGITGVVADGILPGLYGYEAGQAAVGDMLGWAARAFDAGHDALAAEAAAAAPGRSGVLALPWWGGNRSILADADLTGTLLGLTVQTTPGEIYRALLDAVAYGTRRIVENFAEHGLGPREIVACGGIAQRSPLLMQTCADATGLPVHVPDSGEVPARGAALFGAVAAGAFPGIGAAISATRPAVAHTYRPDPAAGRTHDRVYAVFRELYDLLGREHSQPMHELKAIRTERN